MHAPEAPLAAAFDTLVQHLESRASCRAFLDRPVDPELLAKVFDAAKHAPSGANTQPWQVVVLSGSAKQALCTAFEAAYTSGQAPNPDYAYYPTAWQSPFRERRQKCGLQLYQSLGIERGDREAQSAQWQANYRAFDAPVMALCFLDAVMETGSYLDYGMYLQSVLLLAQAAGLGTCPQAALADYPDIARAALGMAPHQHLIVGLAMGYADTAAAVNQYRTERAELSDFYRFLS